MRRPTIGCGCWLHLELTKTTPKPAICSNKDLNLAETLFRLGSISTSFRRCDGKLGTVVSSARFKDKIKPMDKASEAILALKPVSFRYKKELDPDAVPQFGLVAEDVEKVDPALVARDEQGKPYSVRYEAVNAILLNEFLKEYHRVQALEATVAHQQSINAEQQTEIQALTASLKEHAAQIQKVSDLLAADRSAARVVSNE